MIEGGKCSASECRSSTIASAMHMPTPHGNGESSVRSARDRLRPVRSRYLGGRWALRYRTPVEGPAAPGRAHGAPPHRRRVVAAERERKPLGVPCIVWADFDVSGGQEAVHRACFRRSVVRARLLNDSVNVSAVGRIKTWKISRQPLCPSVRIHGAKPGTGVAASDRAVPREHITKEKIMGRQQRNRHPANRLGRRRTARTGEGRGAYLPGNAAAAPDPVVPAEESPTRQRPAGQDSPHQG